MAGIVLYQGGGLLITADDVRTWRQMREWQRTFKLDGSAVNMGNSPGAFAASIGVRRDLPPQIIRRPVPIVLVSPISGSGGFYNIETYAISSAWNSGSNFSGNMIGTLTGTSNAIGVNVGDPPGFHMCQCGETNTYTPCLYSSYAGQDKNTNKAVYEFEWKPDIYKCTCVTNTSTPGSATAGWLYDAINNNGEVVVTAGTPEDRWTPPSTNGPLAQASKCQVGFNPAGVGSIISTNETLACP